MKVFLPQVARFLKQSGWGTIGYRSQCCSSFSFLIFVSSSIVLLLVFSRNYYLPWARPAHGLFLAHERGQSWPQPTKAHGLNGGPGGPWAFTALLNSCPKWGKID